ncbi:hypothetical protein LUW77_27895 [Streptomyces radiopugnans]|nr:hypothetical protein LUW77_27895 [Streptomyces radiopugnans]
MSRSASSAAGPGTAKRGHAAGGFAQDSGRTGVADDDDQGEAARHPVFRITREG